jgi:hypothetical protein
MNEANMSGNHRALRGLAVGVVLAGCAIGLASPASADLTDGTYTMTYLSQPGPAPATLVVTSCGTGCKQVQLGSYAPLEYRLEGNTWTAGDKTIDNSTLAGQVNTWAVQLTKIG